MRPRRLAIAAALLAALALAACTGGEPPPAPEATPAAEAPSTPAPTAEAPPTPAPAPTPEPPPEQACANGVAVEEPEARPGLVADCVALLASRDALRGEASLDWGGDLAIGRWEGVAVGGEPPRVTGLDLRDRGLTGSIPRTLRRLLLDEVRLAGNALTGCVPSAFGDAGGDALYLGLPWCLRYDRLDATGEAAEAGGWAVLDGSGAVITTWDGLRSEAATLRVHQTDAGGTSWASEFGAVSEGGLFEWRKASDCWVRYHVTGPPVRPSGGSGRWEFPVEWMTYAATGEDCKGAIGASTVLRVDEAPPKLMSRAHTAPSQVVTSPVRHGPFLMYPIGWTGEMMTQTQVALPDAPANVGMALYATDVATARQHPLWRDPDLPSEWNLSFMRSPVYEGAGYVAYYETAEGYGAAYIRAARLSWHPINIQTYTGGNGTTVHELRQIDGFPVLAVYSLNDVFSSEVIMWDHMSGVLYSIQGYHSPLRKDIEAAIAAVSSLRSSPGPP